ncbi:AraC family transcriptional regulator [Mycobacteroides abscessus]|uniref:AraC family transcriptional regulator n=1 Tax=Mycobacteroides abscessus TaxID=36809 RepID=UPI0009284C4D|nr:AraC family transcriptional regulator [Mycobacteroides abscessus]SKS45925.1 putative HTH-type transcriptional regulator AraC [Mycobacteroides abscessus subsp. abscessus]SHU43401.1 putative HTH-type transcriptional regulator AraC [Mycobacteroides abscessus subsp. bolletii]SHW81148.1 putative HTH-type transcriptional regulator AraC [Mycobacteroides abscessus subsp. bolletii]SHY00544.1 putative HTH-type transcriptional regulator AraC [Mycobacteroides abscessus subsp. bolletii]SHY57551.1 putati
MREWSIPAQWGTAAIDLAHRQGWDAAEMLVCAGVSPRLLAGELTQISAQQLRTVVRDVLSRMEDESFGVSDVPIPIGTTQILLFSLATSANISAAIARSTAFHDAIPWVPTVTITRSGELATLTIDVSRLQITSAAVTEWLLAILIRGMSWVTMRHVRAHRVRFPQARPDGYSDYHSMFQAAAEFDCGAMGVVVDAAHIDAPFLRTEEEITTLLDRPEEILFGSKGYQQLPDRISRIISSGIGQRIPTVDEIAQALSLTTSSLQRTLRTEFGTSVREIRDATLRDEAIRSLKGGSESLTDLSARLGFSEASAFTRAFRRWTGASPAQYRDGARSVKQFD